VDDFAVKYVGVENVYHLRNALMREYEITMDFGFKIYSGMILKWDKIKCTCGIPMPGYVANVLIKFQHPIPTQPMHSPSAYIKSIYGAKPQYTTRDETPPLSAKQRITILKISGFILYYARVVDPTGVMPWNSQKL
jgi:hypothetical protein